eukprot:TRINITY_DN22594_c0_g1_i1.p1 TRINITY_DN22594_c0_g1~~TRINITY_DN22594_c0_g1_i1.p1  ORF type:complete len:1046 (+),score=254.22 TRINITY_DN22594_c0_g1_i1:92-3229(+)
MSAQALSPHGRRAAAQRGKNAGMRRAPTQGKVKDEGGTVVRMKAIGAGKRAKGGGAKADAGASSARDLGVWHFPKIERPPLQAGKGATYPLSREGAPALPMINHTTHVRQKVSDEVHLHHSAVQHVAAGAGSLPHGSLNAAAAPMAAANPAVQDMEHRVAPRAPLVPTEQWHAPTKPLGERPQRAPLRRHRPASPKQVSPPEAVAKGGVAFGGALASTLPYPAQPVKEKLHQELAQERKVQQRRAVSGKKRPPVTLPPAAPTAGRGGWDAIPGTKPTAATTRPSIVSAAPSTASPSVIKPGLGLGMLLEVGTDVIPRGVSVLVQAALPVAAAPPPPVEPARAPPSPASSPSSTPSPRRRRRSGFGGRARRASLYDEYEGEDVGYGQVVVKNIAVQTDFPGTPGEQPPMQVPKGASPSPVAAVPDPTSPARTVHRRGTLMMDGDYNVVEVAEEGIVQVADGGVQTDLPVFAPESVEFVPEKRRAPSRTPRPLTEAVVPSLATTVDPSVLAPRLDATLSAPPPPLAAPTGGMKLKLQKRHDVPKGAKHHRPRLQPRLAPPRRDPWQPQTHVVTTRGVPAPVPPEEAAGAATPDALGSAGAVVSPGSLVSPPLHLALMKAGVGPRGADVDAVARASEVPPWLAHHTSVAGVLAEARAVLDESAPTATAAVDGPPRSLPWKDEIDTHKRAAKLATRQRPALAPSPAPPASPQATTTSHGVMGGLQFTVTEPVPSPRNGGMSSSSFHPLPSALKGPRKRSAQGRKVQLASPGARTLVSHAPLFADGASPAASPPGSPLSQNPTSAPTSPLRQLAQEACGGGAPGGFGEHRRQMGLDDSSLSLFSFAERMQFGSDEDDAGGARDNDYDAIVTFRLPEVYKRLHPTSFIKEARGVPEELMHTIRKLNGHPVPVEHGGVEHTPLAVAPAPRKPPTLSGAQPPSVQPAARRARRGCTAMDMTLNSLEVPQHQLTQQTLDFEGVADDSHDDDDDDASLGLNVYGGVTVLNEKDRAHGEQLLAQHRVAVEELRRLADHKALLRGAASRHAEPVDTL